MITLTRGDPSARGFELGRLMIGGGAVYATVDWSDPAPGADDRIGSADAAALCAALLGLGRLAYRCDAGDAPPSCRRDVYPEPATSFVERALRRMSRRDADAAFGVAVTDDSVAALGIFAFGGWSAAMQAALVFDPAVAALETVVRELQHGLDWSGRSFQPGVTLLFGTGHDGAFGLVAAPDEARMERFACDLVRGQTASGIE